MWEHVQDGQCVGVTSCGPAITSYCTAITSYGPSVTGYCTVLTPIPLKYLYYASIEFYSAQNVFVYRVYPPSATNYSLV